MVLLFECHVRGVSEGHATPPFRSHKVTPSSFAGFALMRRLSGRHFAKTSAFPNDGWPCFCVQLPGLDPGGGMIAGRAIFSPKLFLKYIGPPDSLAPISWLEDLVFGSAVPVFSQLA
jgi:hypothetical protein